MRVLLAPLFFHQRACKHCARIFYRDNPGKWLGIHEFEDLPPLGSFDTKRGFVPDFPALLMFEEYVIDAHAFERLNDPGDRVWLREWSKLVMVLESEGSLTVEDVGAAASSRSHQRGWMLRNDLADPQRWWQAMGYYNSLLGTARRVLGDSPDTAQRLTWEFDPEATFGVRGSDGEVHDLAAVLLDAGQSDHEAHRELYTNSLSELRGHLREVNACITACQELEVAPIMWAPYRRYLEEKLEPKSGSTAPRSELAGRQFFEIAFPAHQPTTVSQFARLRADKRIRSLREEITRAARTGDLIDPEYPQRVLSEILRMERSVARVRRIASWIATAVGIIPVPGLGLAATAIGEGVAHRTELSRKKEWHWFYLVSDGRGAT